MPVYLYRVLYPNLDKHACPVIEIEHSINDKPTNDVKTSYPIERVYVAPNLSHGYSNNTIKQKISDKNLERIGFTKYIRDPINNTYYKTVGKEGPNSFKTH